MSEDENNLFAIAFDDEYKADEARLILRRAQGEGLIELVETAVVVKDRDGKARLSQDTDAEATDRTVGHWLGIAAAWATGTIPFVMVGTAAGAVVGRLADKGIGTRIMKDVSGELGPGTSALFVLTKPTPHRAEILARLRPLGGTLATSTQSPSDEYELQAAYEQAAGKSP